MREGTAPIVRREEYQAPAYWIRTVDLSFDLDPTKTLVINKMTIERNTDLPTQPLRLDGEDLNLTRVMVNGTVAAKSLVIEATARINGDLSYDAVSVASGAQVEGRVKRLTRDAEPALKLIASE